MKREYDIILYGASGFAAKFIIRELEQSSLRIGLAARKKEGIPETTLDCYECGVDEMSWLTAKTAVLINSAGPFAETGMRVIGACISTGTHYIDISGETGFLLEAGETYGKEAVLSGVKVIQACGFDSLPADIGAMHLSEFMDNVCIDSTIRVWNTKINTGTWNSLINGLHCNRTKSNTDKKGVVEGGSTDRYGSTEKCTEKFINTCKNTSINNNTNTFINNTSINNTSINTCKNTSTFSTNIKQFRYNKRSNSYDVLFRGSDNFVVRKSAEYFKKKGICNIKYFAYFNIGSLCNLLLYFLFGAIIRLLIKFNYGRRALLAWPRLFSFGLVSQPSDLSKSKFVMEMVALGSRHNKISKRVLRISGPGPAYISNAIFVTQCAYTLLENENTIENGILTPAIAFYKTRIIEELCSRGIEFKVQEIP